MDLKRFCHISDLPNNTHYLPIEIKHLLPIHHRKFIDNAHTIINNQANNLEWSLYPDSDLALGASNYAQVSGGWCEDIDGKEQHLKASLELIAIMLNYIHSAFDLNPPDKEVGGVIQRIDHTINNENVVSEARNLGVSGKLMAYNVYRMKDKQGKTRFVFLIGRHNEGHHKLFGLLNSVRQWNLKRLKSDACKQMVVGRCHKLLEHIVMVLRGFMPLDQEDHHNKKRELEVIMEGVDEQSSSSQIRREGLDTDYSLVFSRFQFNFKGKLEHKSLFCLNAQSLLQIVSLMPQNSSCSYLGKTFFNSKLNQIIIVWLMAYKAVKNIKKVDETMLRLSINSALSFLRQKTTQNIRDSTMNIADEMLKSSIKVLNRYKQTDHKEREMVKELSHSSSRQQHSQIAESYFEDRHRMQFDRMSNYSKISFKDRLPFTDSIRKQRSVRDLQLSKLVQDNINQNYEAIPTPLTVHRDKDYAEIIKTVENYQSDFGVILPWTELKVQIGCNCENAKQKYSTNVLTNRESNLLMAFSALNYYLDCDEIVLMLKHYPDYRDSILQILFQKSNAELLLQIGLKVIKQCHQSLYQTYLTKQFKVDRNNLIVQVTKKYLSVLLGGAFIAQLGEKISVPILLDLLQSKRYGDQKYRQLVKPLLNDIFAQSMQLKLIAPFLHQIYYCLIPDHHQELVNGLLADVAYQIIYFSFDNSFINNSPYRKDQNLKQKKLMEMLREGGFNCLGYELNSTLKPIVFKYSNYYFPNSKIYDEIVINRPLHITRFIDILMLSQFTQHFVNLSKYFKSLQREAVGINKIVSNVYLKDQVKRFMFESSQQKIQFSGLKSQSGIFKHLLEYNPQIKIAGMSLSQVLKTREEQKKHGEVDIKYRADYILDKILTCNLQQSYEFIKILLNIKDKYNRYDTLKQDQKIYVRQIVHQVLCRKAAIYEYLQLDRFVKLKDCVQIPFLF